MKKLYFLDPNQNSKLYSDFKTLFKLELCDKIFLYVSFREFLDMNWKNSGVFFFLVILNISYNLEISEPDI